MEMVSGDSSSECLVTDVGDSQPRLHMHVCARAYSHTHPVSACFAIAVSEHWPSQLITEVNCSGSLLQRFRVCQRPSRGKVERQLDPES